MDATSVPEPSDLSTVGGAGAPQVLDSFGPGLCHIPSCLSVSPSVHSVTLTNLFSLQALCQVLEIATLAIGGPNNSTIDSENNTEKGPGLPRAPLYRFTVPKGDWLVLNLDLNSCAFS